MSIESLLGQNPPAAVLSQAQLGLISSGGMPSQTFQTTRASIGRAVPSSASRQLMYLTTYRVEADWEWYTQDSSLGIDEGLQLSDGRLFRIMNSGHFHYEMGNIPAHWRYALKEVRYR